MIRHSDSDTAGDSQIPFSPISRVNIMRQADRRRKLLHDEMTTEYTGRSTAVKKPAVTTLKPTIANESPYMRGALTE